MPCSWRRLSSRRTAEAEFRRKSLRLREGDFLHGELEVEIQEARDLPDTDNYLFNIKRCFGQEKDVTDPYVAVSLDHTRIITTSVVYNNLCPQWNEFFRVSVCHHAKNLVFKIKDQDELGTDQVGEVIISVKELLLKPRMTINGWHDIYDSHHKLNGQVFLKILYKPYDAETEADEFSCPDSYFPLRPDNRVTVYSCVRNLDAAFAIPTSIPSLSLPYSPPSLWIDLYRSIVAATKFIYIIGWSIQTNIKMLRIDDWRLLKSQAELDLCNLTVGELLKKKAEDGVRVLLMIWGETTSIMGTHDTETDNFFKGTRVFVARTARQTKTREYKDLDARFTANLGYSHHQKSVVLDAPSSKGSNQGKNFRRRIVAYVGGVDLTDGRYDTPHHPLFRSLNDEHLGDFYQPCEPGIKASMGPRMPWQDIHVKIEGPAARDIMMNFVERWGKERPLHTRLLIQEVHLPTFDINDVPDLQPSEAWGVQVFRSITSDSARFELEKETSFTTKKGRSVDNSIARAFTAAIRRAKRFIYIENQYFMGSAYGWLDDQDVHCYNVIPMEITERICESIVTGKRFTVYIVIPMHPEGIPGDSAIQEMLFWQRHTMQMMYTRIAQTLFSCGLNCHPTEYLMFFCLGKKERHEDIPTEVLSHPAMGSRAAKLRKSRRSMIYVHSKLLIVDDEYLLSGSANINQRSLDGDRDSELAVGVYQPNHVRPGVIFSNQKTENDNPESEDNNPEHWRKLNSAHGEIFKFRVSLWREHLNRLEPVLADPWTKECAKFVRDAALQNWRDYEDKDGQPEGHLLSYPVDISVSVQENVPVVTLVARTKNKFFPDTKAKILGRQAKSIPNKLTT